MYHHPNLVELPDPGTLVEERRFQTNAHTATKLLAIGFLLIAGGAVAYSYWSQGQLHGKKAMVAFLLPAAGAGFSVVALSNLLFPMRVVVTAEGFAVGDEFCPWTDVVAVTEQFAPQYDCNNLTFSVSRNDGWSTQFSMWKLSGVPQLLAIVHHNTNCRLVAETRAALDRGESVPFGPIEMNATGLRARGRELTWDRFTHMAPDEAGDVGIWERDGKKPWLDVATGKVDNLRVLLKLVEEYAAASGLAAGR